MPTLIVTRLPVVPTAINENGLSSALGSLITLEAENFHCSICLDHCTGARVVLPECLHRFCGNCIEEGLMKCGNECSSFRSHVTSKEDLRVDAQFDNIVSHMIFVV